jgi:hypothetical protein
MPKLLLICKNRHRRRGDRIGRFFAGTLFVANWHKVDIPTGVTAIRFRRLSGHWLEMPKRMLCDHVSLQSRQFGLQGACGPPVPRLDGAFYDVDVAIDYLKVWQSPESQQLRPRQIAVFVPYSK